MKHSPIVLISCVVLGGLALLIAGCGPRPVVAEDKSPEQTTPAAGEKGPPPVAETYAVEVQRNLAYYEGADADKVKHKLDLYSPKGAKDRPVVLFVHGGAWVFGDKNFFGVYEALGKMFARHGVVAVIVNYRLSPGVKHPEHIKDVARAFAWTHRHIKEHGGRADQLFLCGHSAGAHLVSLLATDESYLKAEGLSGENIKGVMSISGVYEVPDKLFVEVFGSDAEVRKQAGPLTHVRAGCPPFLILYADKDYPFCDVLSEKFARALRDKKVPARTRAIEQRNHLDIIGKATHDEDPCGQALLDFIAKNTSH